MLLADLLQCKALLKRDHLAVGKARVEQSHDEQVDEEVLALRRFAVGEHHQLYGFVFVCEFGCHFEGCEQNFEVFEG